MPTYGYRCTECKYEFSVFQNMKDDPVATCPECTGAVKRLLYPVGIVFKGTGWYINESRPAEKTEKSETAAKDERADTKTESGAEAKTDSKADAPSESKPTETKQAETKTESSPAPASPVKPTRPE